MPARRNGPVSSNVRRHMEILGAHRVSLDSIRRVAIICIALDKLALPLIKDSTHEDTFGKTRLAYEELFTENLLQLAIALRTKFYQGIDASSTGKFVNHSGILYRTDMVDEEGTLSFTIKDVCDKIIHAESIHKVLNSSRDAELVELKGVERKCRWELGLSVPLFCEGVLNWITQLENT